MKEQNEAEQKKKDKKGSRNLDKEKTKLNMFDPRGVQTLFRTLSRNHYNLLKMIDNKASIILTINSIIISLLMGALFVAPESEKMALEVSSKILIYFSMISMIFALLSMLPHRYLGKKYNESKYKGSLYAQNFSSHSLEEFKNEFDRIMNSGKSIYDEMIEDLYFLGLAISRKQKILMLSVSIFLIGLLTAMLYSIF